MTHTVPSSHTASTLPRWQLWMPYLTLIAAVFVAYANVYENGFLFDDDLIIRMNENLRHWDFVRLLSSSTTGGAHIPGGFFRPVQMLLYFIVYHIGGETKFGFHLLNVSLHAINACLVYRLGQRMKFAPGACFWAALLWALHPIHTEAITYMSATADPMFAMLVLTCVLMVMPDYSLRKCLMATPVFLLALLSKETAVVAPALIVACIFYQTDKPWRIKPYLNTWPLWIIAILFIVWRMNDMNFDGPKRYALLYHLPEYGNLRNYSAHFSYRVYTFLATLPNYAGLFIWPVGLHMERNFAIFTDFWRGDVVIGALMVGAAVLYVTTQRRPQGKALSWGLLWFAGAHAPDTGLFVTGNSLLLEHWMYLPSVGLFLGIAESVALWLAATPLKAAKLVVIGCCALASVALTIRTMNQNEVWKDAISFYDNIFKYGELSARAHNNMALAYMDRGEPEKALHELQLAVAMTDSYAETRHNMALIYLQLPNANAHVPEAIANLNRALEIDPHFYRSDLALAQIYRQTGDEAQAQYYEAKAQRDLDFMRR